MPEEMAPMPEQLQKINLEEKPVPSRGPVMVAWLRTRELLGGQMDRTW